MTDVTPAPYLVAINLTRRCNLNCAHCYMDAEQKATGQGDELSSQELDHLLLEIAAEAPGAIIVLTGGEPLLRQDLPELVATGAKAGLQMVLGTNGVLLDPQRIAELRAAQLSGMGISLDATRAEDHDAFRGVPGSFDRTMDAIGSCKEAGIHVQIHFTVTRSNQDQIEEVALLAREMGASIINFFFLICVGRGERVIDLNSAEYEHALTKIADLQAEQNGIMVQARCAPHFKRILYERDSASPFTRARGYDGGGCLAATRYCRIDPRGEVTPCPYMEISAGSIRDRSFRAIWRDSPLFRSMREPRLEGRCGSCEYSLLCGGCRARSLVETGNLMAEDPSCEYVPSGKEPVPVLEPAGNGTSSVSWTDEARERLREIPIFARQMVSKKLEERAALLGVPVTKELMRKHRAEREKEMGFKFK